jgi:ABC-type lipoprotein export system ATPase subunit
MLRPNSGKVSVLNRDLYALSKSERASFRATQIGFIFQDFHLVPYLTVRENVLLPLGHLKTSERGGHQDCDQLLERLGLAHRIHHKPSQLSAGERQRTAIARATLLKPPVLLADEPTGNLDEHSAEEVYRVLTEYREQGGTVLVVTHTRSAWTYADQVIQLVGGRVQVDPPVGSGHFKEG